MNFSYLFLVDLKQAYVHLLFTFTSFLIDKQIVPQTWEGTSSCVQLSVAGNIFEKQICSILWFIQSSILIHFILKADSSKY